MGLKITKQQQIFNRLLDGKDAVEKCGILIYNSKAVKIVKDNTSIDAMNILELDSTIAVCEIADYGTDVFCYVINCDKANLNEEDCKKLFKDTISFGDEYFEYIAGLYKIYCKEDILNNSSNITIFNECYPDSEEYLGLVTEDIVNRLEFLEKSNIKQKAN